MVAEANVSLLAKCALRSRIDAVVKRVQVEKKRLLQLRLHDAARFGAEAAAKHADDGTAVVLDIGDFGEKDLAEQVMKGFCDQRPNCPLLVAAVDASGSRAIVLARVPAAHQARLDAVAWVRSCCGGKGGGKAHAAQGGVDASRLAVTLAEARAFAGL